MHVKKDDRVKDWIETNDVTINGKLTTTSGRVGKVVTVTDTYQILVSDDVIICNKTTAFTVTLPVGVVGQIFNIKNINIGVVTVSLSGDTIDGQESQLVYQWDNMKIQCRSANTWAVL